MKHYCYTINGIEYCVYILNVDGSSPFIGICRALLSRLTDQQIVNLTIEKRDGKKVFIFQEIINCFKYLYNEYEGDVVNCICGKNGIEEKYVIQNIDSLNEYIVGSVCIDNWFNKKVGGCKYCGRVNKSGNDCQNCGKKKNIKNIFNAWKAYTKAIIDDKKELITFGKFKGETYYSVCLNKTKHLWWINFVLSDECKTSQYNKSALKNMLAFVEMEQLDVEIEQLERRLNIKN